MKQNFRIIGKIGLLLVVFGFFMPICCQMNGFQIADAMMNFDNSLPAIFLYLLFISALAGCIVGALLLMKKNVKIYFDWICVLVCIGSGLVVFLSSSNNNTLRLQSGAYAILIGWVGALIAQIISKIKNEE